MTVATIGTATESLLFSIENSDLVKGVQTYASDLKFLLLETDPDGFNNEVTMTVDLWAEAGIKRLLGIKGWTHTTENSVIITGNPTVSVDNGIATITTTSGNVNKKRIILLIGV